MKTSKKQYKIEDVLTPVMLNIPQNTQSLQNITKVFNENIKKFKHFYSKVINPLTVC